MELACGERVLSLSRVAIMGVLNVTPDSFSDGGLWLAPDAAVARGIEMVGEGAALVDVGGESTRPGAEPVSEAEELRRVIPVIEALTKRIEVPISIDTRKPGVARRAITAGACMVNDTSGEECDRAMDEVVARSGAAIVVMHSRGVPATMRSLTQYSDVVTCVSRFLRGRAAQLTEAGVAPSSVAVDPGFGFAKTGEQSLELLRRLDEIVGLGYPVLIGTSRKSFIGQVLRLPEDQRLEGTAATVAWAIAKGVHMVRVHDVGSVARVVDMTEAIAGTRH